MAKFTAIALQEVASGQNVQFTDDAISGGAGIIHRQGAGLVTLRGLTNQRRARYRVSFTGNVQIPEGGAVAPISIALSINGEPLTGTQAIVTPAAAEQLWQVVLLGHIDVPRGCCLSVAVRNAGGYPIEVQDSSLIVERIA